MKNLKTFKVFKSLKKYESKTDDIDLDIDKNDMENMDDDHLNHYRIPIDDKSEFDHLKKNERYSELDNYELVNVFDREEDEFDDDDDLDDNDLDDDDLNEEED